MAEHIPCLLLPGSLCDARLFAPLQSAWRDSGKQRPTVVADLHSLTDQRAAWWQQQLQGLPEVFDVLGFSLGGLLALELLRKMPDRVRRLVLVASSPMAGTEATRARLQQQSRQWHTDGAGAVGLGMLQAGSGAAAAQTHAPLVQAMAQDTPYSAFLAQGVLNATRPDGLAVLRHWRKPLLLISGQNDPWCGADKQHAALNACPDARWHEIPDCGHYVPLEQPHTAAQHCADFFAATRMHETSPDWNCT